MGVMRKLRRQSDKERYRVEPLRQDAAFPVRKMSEVILDFAEPLLDTIDDDEYFETVITIAVISWNLSFLPEQEQQTHLNDMFGKLRKSDPLACIEMQDCVQMLLEHKKAFFADDERLVVSYEVFEERGKQRLSVMSVPTSHPAGHKAGG